MGEEGEMKGLIESGNVEGRRDGEGGGREECRSGGW